MGEWLYVLEVNPGARIKVGRTASLGRRMAAHGSASEFGGGELTKVYAVSCRDAKAAEFELIAAVAAQDGAQVVLGREMFTGVTFLQATELAELIADGRRPGAQPSPLPTGLISDCRAAFADDARLHIADLHQRVVSADSATYRHLTVLTLGRALRDVGVRTRSVRLNGRVRQGLHVADFDHLTDDFGHNPEYEAAPEATL